MKFKKYVRARKNNFLMNIKIIFVLVTFVLLLNSCEKNIYHPLDEDYVQYFGMYKDGSWWLYEEVITNSIDSIYIEQYHDLWEMPGDRGNTFYQYIHYKVIGKYKSSEVYLSMKDINTSVLEIGQYHYTLPSFGSFTLVIENNQLTGKNHTSVQEIDSLIIGEYKFYEIVKFWNISGDTLWFVKKTGLVKIADENTTYNIIDYQLY